MISRKRVVTKAPAPSIRKMFWGFIFNFFIMDATVMGK
jgi:hypothetical protein